MKKRILFFIAACAMTISALLAQQTNISNVKYANPTGVKEGDSLSVYMDIVLDDVKLGDNDMLLLTPVVRSNSGDQSVQLSPALITGSIRQKVLERKQVLGKHPLLGEIDPKVVVKRKNRTHQRLSYSELIPYEKWMDDASLFVDGAISGCADCKKGAEDGLLIPWSIGPYVPTYKLTYIVPEVEPVKARADKHTATINFYVDKYNIVRDYENNAAILAEVDKVVSSIMSNNDLSVGDFEINGYASPEATVAHNKLLAQNRANSFADYLSSKFDVSRNRMKVTGEGEDWVTTREVIAASNIADKGEILRIIDNVANPDARDGELKKLSGGRTYQTMLRDYYPQIRRTVYTVSYVVRAFDVEEAKQIIRVNPKLLSLNEMYLVAHSYAPDSKEFKEVFDIATRLYPSEPIAILNSAAADIEGGNNQAAIERLSKIESDARAWNNLGVAHARLGNVEKAGEYFAKAVANGDVDAKYNVGELEKTVATTNR